MDLAVLPESRHVSGKDRINVNASRDLATLAGWVYVAFANDAYARHILGWKHHRR